MGSGYAHGNGYLFSGWQLEFEKFSDGCFLFAVSSHGPHILLLLSSRVKPAPKPQKGHRALFSTLQPTCCVCFVPCFCLYLVIEVRFQYSINTWRWTARVEAAKTLLSSGVQQWMKKGWSEAIGYYQCLLTVVWPFMILRFSATVYKRFDLCYRTVVLSVLSCL